MLMLGCNGQGERVSPNDKEYFYASGRAAYSYIVNVGMLYLFSLIAISN